MHIVAEARVGYAPVAVIVEIEDGVVIRIRYAGRLAGLLVHDVVIAVADRFASGVRLGCDPVAGAVIARGRAYLLRGTIAGKHGAGGVALAVVAYGHRNAVVRDAGHIVGIIVFVAEASVALGDLADQIRAAVGEALLRIVRRGDGNELAVSVVLVALSVLLDEGDVREVRGVRLAAEGHVYSHGVDREIRLLRNYGQNEVLPFRGIRIELRAVLLDRSLGVAVIQLYPKAERSVSGAVYRYRCSLCPAGEQIGLGAGLIQIHILEDICAVVKVAGDLKRVAEGSAADVVVAARPAAPCAVVVHGTVGYEADCAGCAFLTEQAYFSLKVVKVYRAGNTGDLEAQRKLAGRVRLCRDINTFPSVADAVGAPVDEGAGNSSLCSSGGLHGHLAAAAEAGDAAGIYVSGEDIPAVRVKAAETLAERGGRSSGAGTAHEHGAHTGARFAEDDAAASAAAESPACRGHVRGTFNARIAQKVHGLDTRLGADQSSVVGGAGAGICVVSGSARTVYERSVIVGGIAAGCAPEVVHDAVAHDVVRIAEHTVRTAVPVSLDAGEGSFGFHYCAGSASGDLIELLYLTGVRVILIVHGVAGLIICRREQLAVGVIGIAHRCAVRMSYAGKYIRTGIIEGRRIVGAVSYGADVAEAVIGEGRYGLNAAAAVLAGDGENNIVTVADIGDLVAVGILRVAQKAIGEVADVVFLILEGVVRAALGYGQAKAVLIGVLRAGTLEVMHGPVAVKVDEVAGVSGDDRLLYIQHPAPAYAHAAIGLGNGVDRAGSGL